MFDNIGNKIQSLARFGCYVGIAVSVLAAIVLAFAGIVSEEFILAAVGAGVLIVGSLGSWISSWVLYGFGELIENTAFIAAGVKKLNGAKEDDETAAETDENVGVKERNASFIVHRSDERLSRKTPPEEMPEPFKCSVCQNVISKNPCPYCGHNTKDD